MQKRKTIVTRETITSDEMADPAILSPVLPRWPS